MYREIITKIKEAQQVLLFPHEAADGDGVGCCVAMCSAIRSMGKECYILCDEKVADYVAFLDSEAFVLQAPYTPDLAFALDCGTDNRIEKRLAVFRSAKVTCCIDHHPSQEKFADYSVVDPSAASCTVLVWECIKEMGVAITKEIANAIYTGLLTDTGAFKNSNTDGKSHRLAAELLDFGVDHTFICNQVYNNLPKAQMEIESASLNNSEVFADGKAVISYCTYDFWNSLGAPYNYTETSIDIIKKIKGTEVAVMLKEREPGVFKVSLRSKEYLNVREVAAKFGGGGHKMAAACTVKGSLAEVLAQFKTEITADL